MIGTRARSATLELDRAGGRALDEYGAGDDGTGLGPAGDGRGGEEP